MKQIENPKAKQALDRIIEVMNTSDLTIIDQLHVLSNLVMATGASLAGFNGEVPDMETLQSQDVLNPTLDVALMLQGTLMCQWVEDFKQKPVLSDLAKKTQE